MVKYYFSNWYPVTSDAPQGLLSLQFGKYINYLDIKIGGTIDEFANDEKIDDVVASEEGSLSSHNNTDELKNERAMTSRI